jgi:hypothetical protein
MSRTAASAARRRGTSGGHDAGHLAEQAVRRGDPASASLAVMSLLLLRAEYAQHPPLAQTLRARGDTPCPASLSVLTGAAWMRHCVRDGSWRVPVGL